MHDANMAHSWAVRTGARYVPLGAPVVSRGGAEPAENSPGSSGLRRRTAPCHPHPKRERLRVGIQLHRAGFRGPPRSPRLRVTCRCSSATSWMHRASASRIPTV
jgi:hypothetical protein